jgi:hypothetical protein
MSDFGLKFSAIVSGLIVVMDCLQKGIDGQSWLGLPIPWFWFILASGWIYITFSFYLADIKDNL